MPEYVRYLTHPEVVIDPETPVGKWGLSEKGHSRVQFLALSASRVLSGTRSVISSGEVKAMEAGAPLAKAMRCRFEIHQGMHENDRSSTGYLPREQFETMADAFFAEPHVSVKGWERAVDAQARICRAVEDALRHAPAGDILLVGHGAVGTLLLCATDGRAIDRCHDQPGDGGGNAFTFSRDDRKIVQDWTPMEQLRPLR